MAKSEPPAARVPHLSEAFALAQILAPSVVEAERITELAYAEAGAENRFAVLAAVVRAADVTLPAPPVRADPTPAEARTSEPDSPGLPETARTDVPEATAPFEPEDGHHGDSHRPEAAAAFQPEATASFVPEATASFEPEPEPEPPAPPEPAAVPSKALVQTRIAQEAARRHARLTFAELDDLDRTLVFLASRGTRAPEDLAGIAGTTADQSTERLLQALDRIAQSAGLQNGESAADLLNLDDFVDRPDASFIRRVAATLLRNGAPPASRQRSRVVPVLGVIVLGVAAALAVTRLLPDSSEPETEFNTGAVDLLEATAAATSGMEPDLATRNRQEAAIWLQDRFESRFALPRVGGMSLVGVGQVILQDAVRAPVLFYAAGDGPPELSVTVLDYGVLNREGDLIELDRQTLDRLADRAQPELRTVQGRSAVAVRNRDDIYLAVSRQIDVTLAGRLAFPD